MGSTLPGNLRRRLMCGSVDGDGEVAEAERDGGSDFRRDETPEEAARAIADALDFLEQETAKLGLGTVCELINRASNLTRQFGSTRNEAS